MKIREKIQKIEEMTLIKEAAHSKNTLGRIVFEEEDDIRTPYMIDRERIINSKSFRRLKHKTQVYIKTFGDHYRTRLTHTLEVNNVAKTIGVGIGLNCDLIEAISLGHDIGHVPFAHVGEEVLSEVLKVEFKHNVNSVRMVTKIENSGKGLNLTKEVLDGILYHSGFDKKVCKIQTLEGQVVRYSDKIAYVNHDIEDSIRAGLLKEEDLPKGPIEILGETHEERLKTLINDCIYTTLNNIENKNMRVSLSEEIENAFVELRNYMFKNVYIGHILKEEREKAKFVLKHVFLYYINNWQKMPEFYKNIAKNEGIEQGVCDYISGMSDDYCLMTFNEVYVPKLVIY